MDTTYIQPKSISVGLSWASVYRKTMDTSLPSIRAYTNGLPNSNVLSQVTSKDGTLDGFSALQQYLNIVDG